MSPYIHDHNRITYLPRPTKFLSYSTLGNIIQSPVSSVSSARRNLMVLLVKVMMIDGVYS